MLAAELRERLDCRAVHAFGASCHSTAVSEEQCLSLRRLLRVLREQPVLLGAVEDDLLSSFTLTIGEAPEKGSPMARELAEAERTTANYLANYRSNSPRAPPLTLSLPDAFEANEVLELLEEASRQVRHQQPSQRKRGGGGGGRRIGAGSADRFAHQPRRRLRLARLSSANRTRSNRSRLALLLQTAILPACASGRLRPRS